MPASTARAERLAPASPEPPPVSARTAPASAVVERQSGAERELNGILRLLTCGSVDDGKSTLIGRLLFDASDLYDDQRATIERSRLSGNGAQPDFSLLVDGLAAEREQGITIDIAWRYFDTAKRRFVVIDSPGHEQYTRNMASGASHADVAILLVDARAGIKTQTRRHAAILDLVGVRRVVLAVNKMDLVGWSEERYRAIAAEFATLAERFAFVDAVAIPLAAVSGDNVASRSSNMPWYSGPILLDHLDSLPSRVTEGGAAFRMAVQTVLRDGQDFRGLAGTISSGSICVGDRVVDVLSGLSSRVLRIATMDRDLEIARTGQAVALQLEHDLDIARGAVLAAPGAGPAAARRLDARLVWLDADPFDPGASYLLRTATDLVPVAKVDVGFQLDLATLAQRPASAIAMNDIALASITLGRPAALDTFGASAETGCFMLVDTLTGASVAGGVAVAVHADAPSLHASPARPPSTLAQHFVLTREALAAELCADLGSSDADRAEFARRAAAVSAILKAAGVAVDYEI